MDLVQVEGSTIVTGFPRPRGDGPVLSGRRSGGRRVSPPTRGWTRPDDLLGNGRRGFPAHAGMDRKRGTDISRRPRFPRPRGDGPSIVVPDSLFRAVSPPTRGWTWVCSSTGVSSAGFPAHAGMDPARCWRSPHDPGFPRPRGDGPTGCPWFTDSCMVSPPTRGWTPDSPVDRRGRGGFPAHAGMDPNSLPPGRCPYRFPRPRGDGPAIFPPSVIPTNGFPAHAGMDPSSP